MTMMWTRIGQTICNKLWNIGYAVNQCLLVRIVMMFINKLDFSTYCQLHHPRFKGLLYHDCLLSQNHKNTLKDIPNQIRCIKWQIEETTQDIPMLRHIIAENNEVISSFEEEKPNKMYTKWMESLNSSQDL